MATTGRALHPLKTILSMQNWIFHLALFACATVGLLSLVWSITWRSASEEHRQRHMHIAVGSQVEKAVAARGGNSQADPGSQPLAEEVADLLDRSREHTAVGPELVRDLGIALLTSVFVTFVIERYASNRLREHISYDVLSAAYAKAVPEKVYAQVVDSIFRSDIYRRNWQVHIRTVDATVKRSPLAVIASTMSYDVENLNEKPIRFEVSGGIDLDVVQTKSTIPRFDWVAVKDQFNKPLIEELNIPEKESEMLLEETSHRFQHGDFILERQGQQIRFRAPVTIPGRAFVRVTFELKRAIRVPGSFVLYATCPADGITITVSGDELELGVNPLHPNRDALRPRASNVWEFECGILPWQGFQLMADYHDTSRSPVRG